MTACIVLTYQSENVVCTTSLFLPVRAQSWRARRGMRRRMTAPVDSGKIY